MLVLLKNKQDVVAGGIALRWWGEKTCQYPAEVCYTGRGMVAPMT